MKPHFSSPKQFLASHTHSSGLLQIKAEDCLKLEEERVTNYMHQSSRTGLLKEVETELLQQHQTTLLEKEQSGCAALLQDDKVKALISTFCPHVNCISASDCVRRTWPTRALSSVSASDST